MISRKFQKTLVLWRKKLTIKKILSLGYMNNHLSCQTNKGKSSAALRMSKKRRSQTSPSSLRLMTAVERYAECGAMQVSYPTSLQFRIRFTTARRRKSQVLWTISRGRNKTRTKSLPSTQRSQRTQKKWQRTFRLSSKDYRFRRKSQHSNSLKVPWT